jgi:hypothetical protein
MSRKFPTSVKRQEDTFKSELQIHTKKIFLIFFCSAPTKSLASKYFIGEVNLQIHVTNCSYLFTSLSRPLVAVFETNL